MQPTFTYVGDKQKTMPFLLANTQILAQNLKLCLFFCVKLDFFCHLLACFNAYHTPIYLSFISNLSPTYLQFVSSLFPV